MNRSTESLSVCDECGAECRFTSSSWPGYQDGITHIEVDGVLGNVSFREWIVRIVEPVVVKVNTGSCLKLDQRTDFFAIPFSYTYWNNASSLA
jgi:hypothetical protein